MTNYYLSTPLMWNHSMEEIFQTAKEHHLGVEIFHQQVEFQGTTTSEIKSLIKKYKREVFVHAFSWDLNLSSLQLEVREVAIKQTKKSIDFARSIGAKDVTIHPGRMSIHLDVESYDQYLYESMKELMSYANACNQPISFEIMEPIGREFVTTRQALERVAGDLWEEMYVTLDLAHCEDEAMIEEYLLHLPRIRKLHISNHQGSTYHTKLAEGDLDYQALKSVIVSTGLPIVIEGMDTGLEKQLLKENIMYLEENY
ncbi:sugar phosphate isomerase/epimerase family protein [Jeotgalibaca caeni]|uniref:sugar phosphate isomerase/epimerase family protein n=1 Tax=Jeotgalibaca caeni TaxID=3028623 RepID=UPI00237DFB9C|nr:sugar phosphate isomerase/epimerase family protein [Jeotgalibaca caeni]MDE1549172.1 sugar phosphate isomerase/epimerase [Jeotgalibaca caeni]